MTGFSGLPVAGGEDSDVRWAGVSRILGPEWLRLPLLTVGFMGVQILWSVENIYASPYLISLGLSKSLTAIAFLAAPLSGLIVQPLIGVIADNSKSRFGRRRPFILLGTVICVASVLLLAFTRDVVSVFTTRGSSVNNTLTIIIAVFGLLGLDFSVNAVQVADRALIVDSLPFGLQPSGNAWAARMMGFGSVVGPLIGNLDLTKSLPIFGNTQFEILAVIAAMLLLSTQSTTAACVKEKILISSSRARKGLKDEVRAIWDNALTLPRVIRQICIIQFLAWLAWFPILFYTSIYIGDIYKNSLPALADDDDAGAVARETDAERIASRALLYFGCVSLFANIVMPLFVTNDTSSASGPVPAVTKALTRLPFMEKLKVFHICELWAFSHLLFALCMGATVFTSSVPGATTIITLVGFSWAMTQWAPFSLLGEEILASHPDDAFDDSASILMDARSGRASSEPHFRDLDGDAEVVWDEADERHRLLEGGAERPSRRDSKDSGEEPGGPPVLSESRTTSFDGGRPAGALMGIAAARRSRPDLVSHTSTRSNGDVHVHFDGAEGGDGEAGGELDRLYVNDHAEARENSAPRARPGGLQAKSGIIIGIHNLFIVVPQFISLGLTSLIFAIFEPGRAVVHGHHPGVSLPGNSNGTEPIGSASAQNGTDSLFLYARQAADDDPKPAVNAVAIVFRIVGVAALFAFVICWRLARELKRAR